MPNRVSVCVMTMTSTYESGMVSKETRLGPIKPHGRAMAASQSKSSAATTVLTDIFKLEELKKDTRVTRRELATVKHILALKDKTQFELLITNLMKSYSTMLKKTRQLKLIVTKQDRL